MKNILIPFVCLLVFHAKAQTVILRHEVKDYSGDSTKENIFAADKKFSTPVFFGIGIPVSQSEVGGEIENFPSIQLTYGTMYKFEFSKIFQGGFTLSYDYFNYRIKQTPDKILPVPFQSNKETIRLHALDGGAFFRIVYDPSKKGQGKYIDLGADALWIVGRNHRTWNDGIDGTTDIIKTRHLPYTKAFQYSVMTRIGFGDFALNFNYRLSDAFKPQFAFPELPRYNMGIDFFISE